MIVLGSTSPRRKELMNKLTHDFKIMSPSFDESNVSKETKHYALTEAYNKSLSLKDQINQDDCLITVDTIVVLNDVIYGKPKNLLDAKRILKELSNNTHQVISGYVIFYKNNYIKKEVITNVTFNKLSDQLIERYVNETNVLDKAGAYALQIDAEYKLVKKVEGDLNNVIGFPLESIKKDLESLGLL